MFSGLVKLKELVMRLTNLDDGFSIPTNSFQHISNLTDLNISENDLCTLDPEVFSHVPKLDTLDLSGNNRLSISQSLFIHLKELKDLKLYENQVNADVEESFRKIYKLTYPNNIFV